MNTPDPPEPAESTTIEPVVRRRSRRARRWAVALITLVSAWLLISFTVAVRLTSRHHLRRAEPAPDVAWARFENLRLTTEDGQSIGGWYAEGRDDAPAILFLHGNGGGRAHCLGRAKPLVELTGCALMFISLRAHGDSSGDFNDIGFSARRDVVAAVDYLRARRPGRPIIVHGVSLGSAAASFAGADLGDRVSGYVLESPYRDLKTAVRNRTSLALPTPLDDVAYVGLRFAALFLLPNLDEIAPVRAVAAIPKSVPILILSGEADDLATPQEARDIFDQVKDHGRLETFPGARHNDLAEVDPDRYLRLVTDFVSAARPPAR